MIQQYPHPVDREALRIYDLIWAEANRQRWNQYDAFLADKLEEIAAELYTEIRERALRR